MSMYDRIVSLVYGLALLSLLLVFFRGPLRKYLISFFIAFYIFAWLIPGIHESHWPFLRWALFAARWEQDWELSEVTVITSDGMERPMDDRLYDPIHPVSFERYISRKTFPLPDEDKQKMLAHFHQLFNRNLALMRNDTLLPKQPFGITEKKLLGYFAFPPHDLGFRRWDSIPSHVRIEGIRIYKMKWNVYKRHQNPQSVQRELVYEYMAQ